METKAKELITQDIIDSALSYDEFVQLADELFEQGITTDGVTTDSMLDYTKISVQRLKRIKKSGKLFPEFEEDIRNNKRSMVWLVLNEGWCGDGSQILPFMFKMGELAGNIDVKVILREKHPEIMDAHLTNGKRTIPKLIALDADTLEEIGGWGSRPKVAEELFEELKADESLTGKERQAKLHMWYTKNKGYEIQKELVELLRSVNA